MAVNDKFNYHFLVRAHVVASTKIETMGVAVEGYDIKYVYNPEFVSTLPEAELIFILRHEVMHLALHHCTSRQPSDPHRQKLANIAMDLAINSMIPNNSTCACPTWKEDTDGFDPMGRPKPIKAGDRMGMFPDDFGYPRRLSYEQYMEMLEKDFPRQKGDPQPGSGGAMGEDGNAPYPGEPMAGTSMDNHDGFAENAALSEEVKNQIANISKTNSWGTMPGDIQSIIQLAQVREISWRSLIRHQYGKFIHHERDITMRRPNKKMGYPFPGYTFNSYTDAAYVFADTSASVSDEELGKFLRETSSLAQHIPVYFQMFDTELSGEATLIKGKIKKNFSVSGRGGTDFQACFDYAIAKKVNKIILFSDGYASEPDYKSFKGQILWVITKGGNENVKAWRGKKVYLNAA